MYLGNRQTCHANMVLICFQSSGKWFSSKREKGGNISLREREKKINKYFAEGELRGPLANPEQITGKQNQLAGEYRCSKHTALTWPASTLQFPALPFLNTLAKKIGRMCCIYSRKIGGDPSSFMREAEEDPGVSTPSHSVCSEKLSKDSF